MTIQDNQDSTKLCQKIATVTKQTKKLKSKWLRVPISMRNFFFRLDFTNFSLFYGGIDKQHKRSTIELEKAIKHMANKTHSQTFGIQ